MHGSDAKLKRFTGMLLCAAQPSGRRLAAVGTAACEPQLPRCGLGVVAAAGRLCGTPLKPLELGLRIRLGVPC